MWDWSTGATRGRWSGSTEKGTPCHRRTCVSRGSKPSREGLSLGAELGAEDAGGSVDVEWMAREAARTRLGAPRADDMKRRIAAARYAAH